MCSLVLEEISLFAVSQKTVTFLAAKRYFKEMQSRNLNLAGVFPEPESVR